jgi:hypothetical protein
MGRLGSLIASTCRSNQSFTAWLVPHTIGPARITPRISAHQRCPSGTPDETTPQPKAHIGANHVIGFSNSSITGIDEGGRLGTSRASVTANAGAVSMRAPSIRARGFGIAEAVAA